MKDTRVYRSADIGNENILKTFSIALKNRYQVLEDEGLKVEEDEEIERDFQVMERASTEVAERVLGRPGKWKNHLPVTHHGNL